MTATGCRLSVSPWNRGTKSVFSSIWMTRYSRMTYRILSGSVASVTSTPTPPPIHGPMMGTSSVSPGDDAQYDGKGNAQRQQPHGHNGPDDQPQDELPSNVAPHRAVRDGQQVPEVGAQGRGKWGVQ